MSAENGPVRHVAFGEKREIGAARIAADIQRFLRHFRCQRWFRVPARLHQRERRGPE